MHRYRPIYARNWPCIAIAALMLAIPTVAQEADAPEYTAQTTQDPNIPKEELALLVKPLTATELIVEADAWLKLIQAQVRKIVAAEIAVKRKNQEIAAAKDTAAAVEDMQDAVERSTADESAATEDLEEASARAMEAAQRGAEVSARTDQDEDVRAAVEEAASEAGAETPADTAPPQPEITGESLADPGQLAATAETAKQAAEQTASVKETLLDQLNRLREERTALIDRMRVVLDELDAKSAGEAGAETKEHRQYIKAVSGVEVDTSDWDAVRATIMGWFTSSQGGVRWGLNIASFLGILAGFWFLSLVVGRIADRALKTRYTRNLGTLMREFLAKMIRRTVLVIGVVVALTSLEVNTAPLLAAIGAAGFVVAFALQDSLSNFASGIMILMYRPFDVGDVVDTGGVSGTVTSLNLVSVAISTFDNKTVLVPNNKVWNDVIVNATNVRERRVDLVFGIGYQDDMNKAQSILERIVSEHELVLKDPEPVVRVHELGDSSVNFICRPWVKTADYWTVYWDIMRAVKEAFDREGVSIPFPQRDVHVYHANADGGPTNGD
jgi:small conductance mechanosensitive channel